MYTREIIGFCISRFHNSDLVCGTLVDALKYTDSKVPLFLHSDQGSEYDSGHHIQMAEQFGIQISMSKKASPWENGFQESFFSHFKLDLGDPNRFDLLGELIEEISLIVFRHNNVKTHSVLKMSPVNFRKLYDQKVINFTGDFAFKNMGT